MHGIERAEIEQLKQINLKEYLLSFDKDNYLGKKYNHYMELRNIILKLL